MSEINHSNNKRYFEDLEQQLAGEDSEPLLSTPEKCKNCPYLCQAQEDLQSELRQRKRHLYETSMRLMREFTVPDILKEDIAYLIDVETDEVQHTVDEYLEEARKALAEDFNDLNEGTKECQVFVDGITSSCDGVISSVVVTDSDTVNVTLCSGQIKDGVDGVILATISHRK